MFAPFCIARITASFSFGKPIIRLIVAALLGTLTACGGGGSGGGAQPSLTESALEVNITFPLDGAATDGRANLTVSGTIDDQNDGELAAGDISAFTVNGVPATVDFNTGRWQAGIALDSDSVDIETNLVPVNGTTNQAAVTVNNSPILADYELLNVSPDGSTALVYGSGDLRRVNLVSGAETPIIDNLNQGENAPRTGIRSDTAQQNVYLLGWGVRSSDAYTVELDAGSVHSIGNLWYAGDRELMSHGGFDLDPVGQQLVYSRKARDFHGIQTDACSILAIPLTGGPAAEVAYTSSVSNSPAAPTVPFCPGPLVVDSANNRVIVAADAGVLPDFYFPESSLYGLYAYDLASGAGSILSDAQTDSGPLLYAPKWLFLTAAGDRVLAVDEDRILWVDLTTGSRSLAMENPNMPDAITDVDFDEPGERLVVANSLNRLSALSLDTGEWGELSTLNRAVGSGPALPPAALSLADNTRRRLYVIDKYNLRLLAVNLDTLEREVIATDLVPGNFGNILMTAPALDSVAGMFYFFDLYTRQLIGVDLSSGSVHVITSPTVGSGPGLSSVTGLTVDEQQGLIYAAGVSRNPDNYYEGLISIDIATGSRALVSRAEQDSGSDEQPPQGVLYDAENDRVLAITANGTVLAIEPTSGQRTVLFDSEGLAESQESEFLFEPQSMAWDSTPGRLLVQRYCVATSCSLDVRSIDLGSGQRSIIMRNMPPVAFDPVNALIYSTGGLGRAVATDATDRYSRESVTIAYPEGN